MSVIPEKVSSVFKQLDLSKTLWIAFSGGADSTVLLHAAKSAAAISGHKLKAIHVNHQIHDDSHLWSDFCAQQCELISVPLKNITINVDSVAELGVEGAARYARYRAFEQCLGKNDVLFTAHHADDQIETILMQLFRGAGVQGLTGCAAQRDLGLAKVMRPFLEVSREQIIDYARQHQLEWLDDPSNESLVHDRNYLRHKVLPLLHERWRGLRETIARSSQWQIESAYLLDRLAGMEMNLERLANPLPVKSLKGLELASIKNILRCWIREFDFPMPSAQILNHIVSDVINSAEDAQACVQWQTCECRKYRNNLYLQKQLLPHDAGQNFVWEIQSPLYIPSLNLELTREQLESYGVNCDRFDVVQVKFRQGGETLRPKGRGCQKDLKSLFQEAAVEPWLRDRIPLIYDNDSLVFVWGYWIHEAY